MGPVTLDSTVSTAGHPAVYDALVALHVVCAVVGFGAVAVSGAYGAIARRHDCPGVGEETRRYFSSAGRAEYLMLAVPVLGAAAMGVRPGGSEYSSAWIVGGMVIWVAAAALLVGVVRPAEARIRAAVRTGPPPGQPAQVAPHTTPHTTPHTAPVDTADAARRLMWAAAACDLLFVAALFLMVTQPG